MSRLKKFILKEGHEAYMSLFVALVAVILMWSVALGLLIKIDVGDNVNLNWLMFLNMLVTWDLLFIGVAILFGLVAFSLALGSWKKLIIISASISIMGFCGLMAFAVGMGDTYTYSVTTSTQYGNYTFKVIHAYRNGDMIADADYLLAQCDSRGNDCKITHRFEDYRCCGSKSKPASFYVEPSENALYIKVGDETTLVSKI